jgi:hypothetical protein
MPQANLQNTTPSELNITANEALFLHCILQCQKDYGTKPPAILALPRAIGVVVDYDYVTHMMHSKLTLWSPNHTGRDKIRHQKRTKAALKAARTRLMHARVIGCHDPFVWMQGQPIGGSPKTRSRADVK